jgi:hypothetical protein
MNMVASIEAGLLFSELLSVIPKLKMYGQIAAEYVGR